MASFTEQFKKSGNNTQRAITALGVLSGNGSSDMFYTASDVTEHLISTAGLGKCSDDDFFELSAFINVSLSQTFKTGNRKGMYATDKKINPTICKRLGVKSATGYRMGLPINEKSVTQEDIQGANAACKNPRGNDCVTMIRSCNDYNVLLNLQSEIASRLSALFVEKDDTILMCRDKLATGRKALEAFKDI